MRPTNRSRGLQCDPRDTTGEQLATTESGANRRRSERVPRNQPFWWCEWIEGRVESGLLVERSADGAAFLTRARAAPLVGTRIMASARDPADSPEAMELAMVRRVQPVHADLFLVAAQFARNLPPN